MRRNPWLGAALLASALLVAAPLRAGQVADRLDRFRVLAASRLPAARLAGGERAQAVTRELYALLDEEIVESLASGGVFASPAFLQERLDGFAEAWGGASLRLARVGPLTVGAFQLGDGGEASVRVYGRLRGEAALLAAFQREGRPTVHGLPPAAGGAAQFLVTWEGAPSGRGSRALRVDLVRQRGDDVAVAWSTAEEFPQGLPARAWRVRGGEVRVRYELRYPGWVPGCEPQTEQEDLYRLAPGGLVRISRRQVNPWHRALHEQVDALLAALAAGDHGAVQALVPDERLRGRLPAALAREAACDAVEPPGAAVPTAVSVAATADRRPWALVWRRAGDRWRLAGAAPVLQ